MKDSPPPRKKRGCGIVSRIIPYDLNRWGAGSHLYTAHANTARCGSLRKGLTGSHGLFPLGLPSPHHIYIVPQTFRLVNTFFCQVLYFSEKILGENLVAVFPSEWVSDARRTTLAELARGFLQGVLPIPLFWIRVKPASSTFVRSQQRLRFCSC